MRSKLLGLPTSIAFASVRTEGRGAKTPVARYAGTTSFTLVAAMNRSIARPDRLAISPAVRLPKFPLGVQTVTGAGAERAPPAAGLSRREASAVVSIAIA